MVMMGTYLRAAIIRIPVFGGMLAFNALLIISMSVAYLIFQTFEYREVIAQAVEVLGLEAQVVGEYADETALRVTALMNAVAGGLAPNGQGPIAGTATELASGIPELRMLGILRGDRIERLYERNAVDAATIRSWLESARWSGRIEGYEIAAAPAQGRSSFLIRSKIPGSRGDTAETFAWLALEPSRLMRRMMFIDSLPDAEVSLTESAAPTETAAGGHPTMQGFMKNEPVRTVPPVDRTDDGRMVSTYMQPGSPFAAIVSLPANEVLAYWQRDKAQILGLISGTSLLLLLLTVPIFYFVVRPLSNLRRSVARISQGRLDRRLDPVPALADVFEVAQGVELMRRSLHALTSGLSHEVESKARALAERTKQLDLALESIEQGLLMLDLDGRIVLCNARFTEMIGAVRHRAWPGASLCAVVEDSDRNDAAGASRRAAIGTILQAASEHCASSYTLFLPDERFVEVFHKPVRGGSVITFVEVSRRRHAHLRLAMAAAEARRANETKTRFLANMSHELRTPLNAVIGFAEIIELESMGPVGQRRYVEYAADIRSSALHLLALIKDLLDTARIETGSYVLYKEELDLGAVLRWTESQLRQAAAGAGVELSLDVPDEPLCLHGDLTRLRQAILNVAGNAVKFTPRGGRVEIRVWRDGTDNLNVLVADTGIGIAPEDMSRVLLPFEQGDTGLARRYEGAGLGLPLAKGLIEAHGGRFGILSAVGAGTRVEILLPARRIMPSAETVASAHDHTPRQGIDDTGDRRQPSAP